MENIYIEGIQGMGKSTLLSEIARRRPEYRVCREGDYSPVDLAWCAWMDGEQYASVLERYAPLRREIEEEACREESAILLLTLKFSRTYRAFTRIWSNMRYITAGKRRRSWNGLSFPDIGGFVRADTCLNAPFSKILWRN